MEFNELPRDLAELEREVAGRLGAEPSPGLRRQVLAAVGRELRGGNGSMWKFAAAVAAAVLLAINLSMSVANHMDRLFAGRADLEEIDATTQQILLLAPEMSQKEAHRYALVLQVGTRTAPAARIHWSGGDISLLRKEQRQWATY